MVKRNQISLEIMIILDLSKASKVDNIDRTNVKDLYAQ